MISENIDHMKRLQQRQQSAHFRRPLTSAAHNKIAPTLNRPTSTLSFKRPISGHAQLNTEKFFTKYNREVINIGDDIPFEELFDRNERTICATFAKFGDLSYHTPNYRIGSYMQFPAKLKFKHLHDIIALQNTITNIEKNEFEIPIQLSVIEELNPTQKKVKTGISSVFKKEEVEREPITVSLFPEYFEDSEEEDAKGDHVLNKEAKKYFEKHLKKMGGSFDPEKIGQDEYLFFLPNSLPKDILDLLTLSYKRYYKYLNDQNFIRNEEIARFRKDWISNAISRVPEGLLRREEELIRTIFQEVFADYRNAVKKSIMNYILLSSEERRRLSIPLLLRESPPSAERISKAGAFSVLLYHQWHGFVENGRNYLQNNLYNMNIVNSSIVNWNEDFRVLELVETDIIEHMAIMGKSMNTLTFMKIQRNYRDRMQAFMRNVWLKGALLILKKFKYLRIHKEKKGCWHLLGFNKDKLDLKEFLKNSFDTISAKSNDMLDDSGEAIFNVINTRVSNSIIDLNLIDVPLNKWGSIEFDDLLDIRDCSSYQYYALYNREPISLAENGYKMLNDEVRARLRSSVGVLLGLKLREKIEESLKTFEKIILDVPVFTTFVEDYKRKNLKSLIGEDSRSFIPSSSVVETEPQVAPQQPVQPKPSSAVAGKASDKKAPPPPEPEKPIKIQFGRTIGPEFDFNELKQIVEPVDVFFLTIRFSNQEYLRHQSEFRPFLQLDMIFENEIIRFADSEDIIRAMFTKMHGEIVELFKFFPHPEYASIILREDPIESHPRECVPSDNNFEAFYKRFMPKIEMREKKRKRKVQSILENAQIEEVDEKAKHLNVNESNERHYTDSCQKIVERVAQHYAECKVSFSLFDQFRLVLDKTLDKYARAFTSKNHIALEDFRKNLLIIRAYKGLLDEVPDQVYFPLFEVRTHEVKKHIRRLLADLEKMIVERVKDFILSELFRIESEFNRIKETMQKPIENATQYQQMEEFMIGLTQEKIQLRNKSNEIYRKMIYCLRLDILDSDITNKVKDVYRCPSDLENTVNNVQIKHLDSKNKIIEELRLKQRRFEAMVGEVNQGLIDLQGVMSFDQYGNNSNIVRSLDETLRQIEEDRRDINDQEAKLFGKQTEYKVVADLRKRLAPNQELWESVNQFMTVKKDIYNKKVYEVNLAEIDEAIADAERAFNRMKVTFSKNIDESKVIEQLSKNLESLKVDYPKVALVCNKGLAERHWDQIKQVLNNAAFNYKEDRLSDLLDNPEVERHLTEITEISRSASMEYKLLQMINKIESDWKEKRFEMLTWKNTDILIFSGNNFEEIQNLLDENVLRIQTIRSEPAVRFIEAIAAEWESTLVFMQEACEVWVKVQQAYIYLVPVFNSEDIRTHMAKAAAEFKKIQNVWEELTKQVSDNPSATAIKNIPNLLPKLKDSLATMEGILKELDDYLDMKRTKFSRFYFLSNEEMLSILSETKDPQLVQPHLKKCFEGINELVFTLENDITGMKSELGEVIDFDTKIVPKNYKSAVEEWLVKIEEQMKISLKARVEEALIDLANYKKNRGPWLKQWAGQCILVCSQMSWTMLVEDRLKMIKLMKELKDELQALLEEIVALVRGELTVVERTTLNALITLEVHNLHIVNELIALRCNSTTDFDWISQLRYYIQPQRDRAISVEMVVTKLDYGFEYLGNTPRLVITPLTDRCYRTLMTALFLNLGGAPEGPAGTGKTETTKDLAKAVAIQCVVHNCTGSINSGAMAKFFKGLVSSGAWSCFDEFNRIQLEVLSVIAQQIHQIQSAKSNKAKEFRFDGSLLKLKDSCNIFITMNPGYAGRSELPDNLKSLFRPVAMMVPDYTTIAEISLYSTGFIEAPKLSKKIVSTYKLCSEQLSSQYHYDYGMRAVKSVLITAAMLKRRYRNMTEDEIVLLSIKDVNLPKFVNQDIEIFKAILKDLFPENQIEDKENPKMDEAINKVMRNNKLTPHAAFKLKVFQLNEMIRTRHGLMLVGDGMSGKSTVFKTLAQSLSLMNDLGEEELKVNYCVMNPKSVSLNQLFGWSDPISQEWYEGILSLAFKQASKRHKTREWLVLDGPVDAEWIENMNTVLDDNKVLCLMSSDKIPMSKFMTMVFETENLAKASPATVSRCGMIYLNQDLVGIRSYFLKWMQANYDSYFDLELKEHVTDLFDAILRPAVGYIESNKRQYQYLSEMHLTECFLNFFKVMLREAGFEESKPLEEDTTKYKPKINILFLHAAAWSLGMTVVSSFRKEIDKFLRRAVADSVKSETKKDRILKFDKDITPPEFNGSMM